MELISEYGNVLNGTWQAVSHGWDKATVVTPDGVVVKTFRGELSEQNADRYAWDLYAGSGEAW